MVQAAPKLPNVVLIGNTYGEPNRTFCLVYNEESEVKKSYWGLFGSYHLSLSLLGLLKLCSQLRRCPIHRRYSMIS